ncbi:hypothetical protein OV203_42815 [Nannocystis sp. ILAH1]|uniref:hypothetical protein n=1 Tax=Nannocystis sp. ILAH1 TaxID=2996789 RepID=UPI0022714FEF|nr:hypothetical protein [Nannocystis sp. ILAH1]MCY0993948.1 hypothetical protein [Nannocystis sp. ILAH1]
MRAWDNRQNVRRWTYDVLTRPTHAYLKHAADPEVLQQRIVYGESLGVSADVTNHLGQVYRVYDSAGVLTTTTASSPPTSSPTPTATVRPSPSTPSAW